MSKMPKYIEVYSRLRQEILRGEYPPGSFLPTENELVEKYSASKTTVRHAVKLLREQALVDVKQGSGTKVLAMEQETVQGKKYNIPDTETSVLVRYVTGGSGEVHNTKAVIDQVPAGEAAAKILKVPVGSLIYRMQRLQLVDGIPFGYMVNYLSPATYPDLLSKGELLTDLYGFLFKHYNTAVTSIEESIDAMSAGFMEAQFLQVEIGAPLLLLKRTATDQNTVVEYCETTMRPDIFHMTIKIASQEISGATPFFSLAP